MIYTPNITAAVSNNFDPRSVPGLVLNYDFSDLSTLTLNGSTISEVRDKSGFGNNATQSTAAYQPTLTSNALRGRSVATFDNTNDFFSVSNLGLLRNVSGGTLIVVLKYGATSVAQQTAVVISNSIASTSARATIAKAAATGFLTAGGRRLDGDTFASVGNTDAGTGWLTQGAVFRFESAFLSLWRNQRVEVAPTTFQTSGNTSDTNSLAITIGATNTLTVPLNGSIAEVLVFNRAVTDAEMIYLQNGLMQKWGISA